MWTLSTQLWNPLSMSCGVANRRGSLDPLIDENIYYIPTTNTSLKSNRHWYRWHNSQGITVICSKKGGDPSSNSHCEWLLTVPSMPDAIYFSFIPITSLLKGVPGKGFLSHAINLYLRCKPPNLYLLFVCNIMTLLCKYAQST